MHKRIYFVALSTILANPAFASYSFPAIPIEECRLDGIGIGSSYKLVVDSVGPADDEKRHSVTSSSTEKTKTVLKYKGLYVSFSRDQLRVIKDTGAGLTLPNGISVGSSEVDLVTAYGEPTNPIDDARAYLAFECVEPGKNSSGILLQFLIVDGAVDNIVINKNY